MNSSLLNQPPTTSAEAEAASLLILKRIFEVNCGRRFSRVNGQAAFVEGDHLVVHDADTRMVVGAMPLAAVSSLVSDDEVEAVTTLQWDGRNEWLLNGAVLHFARLAIERYHCTA